MGKLAVPKIDEARLMVGVVIAGDEQYGDAGRQQRLQLLVERTLCLHVAKKDDCGCSQLDSYAVDVTEPRMRIAAKKDRAGHDSSPLGNPSFSIGTGSLTPGPGLSMPAKSRMDVCFGGCTTSTTSFGSKPVFSKLPSFCR